MPSETPRQQRFMGAELARKRAGKKTKTGMSEQQLREFAGSVKGGSLEDITYLEEDATCDVAYDGGKHPIHAGYKGSKGDLDSKGAIVWGNDEFKFQEIGDGSGKHAGMDSALRDVGNGVHMGAPVSYFGPDTDYRAEEIDPHQYGRDWEPIPFRDYYKTEDNQFDRGFRLREQDEYDQTLTPGAVTEENVGAEAYGAVNFREVDKERDEAIKDYRNFDAQRRFARSSKDKAQEYAVDISGHDTKHGDDIK